MAEERPINRRHFFRHGLSELLRPLVDKAGPLEEALRQINAIDMERQTAQKTSQSQPSPTIRRTPDVWLRPPGALPEEKFRETCSRCGECAKVCPAQCIKIDPTSAKGAGVPYIEIDSMPCVMCDGLLCMHNCPSGALLPTPIGDIDMGTAVWHENLCLRPQGQDCTICIDQCPIGEVAIQLLNGKINVLEPGCTGCGVCQHYCPTSPKSITITPRATGGPVSRTTKR
jgi:ferredoxin-type protein NapG